MPNDLRGGVASDMRVRRPAFERAGPLAIRLGQLDLGNRAIAARLAHQRGQVDRATDSLERKGEDAAVANDNHALARAAA